MYLAPLAHLHKASLKTEQVKNISCDTQHRALVSSFPLRRLEQPSAAAGAGGPESSGEMRLLGGLEEGRTLELLPVVHAG